MLDDDIQYLGSRIKLRDPPRYTQRILNGVALHIEKSYSNEAYVLKFCKDKASTVHVGRRPGTEIESRTDQDKGRAMFRCAVVSRRHAKIVFSDSGNVYLIDLGSHHGTHIRRPGETSSRMLEREIPAQLSDGDIITFGKSVGRSEEMVRPVVARVQLLYNGPSTSTIKPLVVPDNSPSTNNRSHSGRYGLHSPSSSSSSSDAYNGQSDVYSDIEEIPPPYSIAPAGNSQAESQPKPESHLGRAIEVLKRLLPPTSIPSIPGTPSQRDVSPRLEEQSPIHSKSSSPSSLVSHPPSDLAPLWSIPPDRASPFPLFPRCSSISSVEPPDNFFSLPPINPTNDGDHSRSESPMDLASPSPPPTEQEPRVIGGWAEFASPSPSESELIVTPSDNGVPVASQAAEMPAAAVSAVTIEHEENHEAEDILFDEGAPSSSSAPIEKGKEKEKLPLDLPHFITRCEYEDLKLRYTNLKDEIDRLQVQRRKYKSKFNANVHTVTEKFHELEDKMNDMTAQCTLFVDQIESITSADVPDIQARIDDLVDESDVHQMRLEELKGRVSVCEEKMATEEMVTDVEKLREEKEKAQKSLEILGGLIEEMKALRATTEREIEAELQTLRQLRETILTESAPATPAKRKRPSDDEDDRDAVDDSSPVHNDVPANSSIGSSAEFQLYDRPRKRARKVVSVAAQTVTAVTMGAVATWVALAFS